MKKIFLTIITASLVIIACNGKKETTNAYGNSDSVTVENTLPTEQKNPAPDSAAIKAKEDSLVKAHGHKH